ncbi:MAG: NFACT RNA binding domain-containing protein [Candidatus Caldatribacteriota bacterium]|nr:NFACT RNA binding domain-containing protein [Candidatus Caldatribacteriota bacterium]
MSLDSITLEAMRKELLDKFKEGKIISIIQTKKYKIIIEVKPDKLFALNDTNKKSKSFYIHISIDPSLPEIYFSKLENKQKTISSPFLALLQNQLKVGKILDIEHSNFDRILHFIIRPYQKFGKVQNKILVVEFMGKHGNMILLKEDKTIETSIKLIDSNISRYREIMPGKLYIPPPSQNKLNPLKINREDFLNIFYSTSSENKGLSLWKLIQDSFMGISPQSAKEVVLQANLSPEMNASEASTADLKILWISFNRIVNNIKNHNFQPTLFFYPLSKKIKAWSIIDSVQFRKYHKRTFNEANSCLESLFTKLEKERELLSMQNKLDQIIRKNMLKINNKINDCQKKLEEVKNCEKYKISGELIKANLSSIKRGDREVITINYYSPQQENITIPLNNKLTPLENARLYFKKYRKTKDSFQIIFEQLNNHQLKHTQLTELQKLYEQEINSLPNLYKIYNNLTKLGWVKKAAAPLKKAKKETNKLQPAKYISKDGWEIYLGKNNLQNDFLTFKLASGNDTWLHAKNIHGSHVIIKNKGSKQSLPLGTLIQAANLAAYFSKAKKDNKVLVDYTFKKYVKKPKNAKPGMVIYSQEKSLWIKIDSEEIGSMKKVSQK